MTPLQVAGVGTGSDGVGPAAPVDAAIAELFAPTAGYRDAVSATTEAWADIAEEWESRRRLPSELFVDLGRAGLFRRRWEPGEGPGLPYALVLVEELSRLSGGAALAVMTHLEVFLGALTRLARTPGHLALIDQALAGTAVGCFALTEREGGSDITALSTTAEPVAGGWHLTGTKRFVSNASTSTHALVVARLHDRLPEHGLSLFLVPIGSGVRIVSVHDKVGVRACDMTDLALDVTVDGDALLGAPGAAMLYVNRLLELERLSIAWQLLVSCRWAMGLAAAFARHRPIGVDRLIDKQAVRHRLAEAQISLWTVEAMFVNVATAVARGGTARRHTAGLKLATTQVASRILDDCLQLLGGRGCLTSFPVEGWWRDARVARLGGGTDDVMREIVGTTFARPHPGFDGWLERLEAGPDESAEAAH